MGGVGLTFRCVVRPLGFRPGIAKSSAKMGLLLAQSMELCFKAEVMRDVFASFVVYAGT